MKVETDALRPMLRQIAYERFMDSLYAGKLRPGLLVSQREICNELEVPMGPMREALKRLEVESIVTLIPQRAVQILDVNEKTISDVFQLRLMIEPEAVRLFDPLVKKGLLTDLLERTETAASTPIVSSYLDIDEISALTTLDRKMHRMFVEAMDNTFATELFDRMLGKLKLTRLVFWLRSFSDGGAAEEHVAILKLVLEGNADAAAAEMKKHLVASRQRALCLG